MAITPNMTLTTWTNLSDRFNYLELADNFQRIDEHNHTGGGKGLKIPAGGLDSLSVATSNLIDASVTKGKLAKPSVGPSEIEDGAVTTGKIADEAITEAKMSPTVSSEFTSILDAKVAELNSKIVTPEDWRVVGTANNPSFQSSWTNVPSIPTLAFYKDPNERVWFRGGLKGGTPGTVALTLPEGYRPALSEPFGLQQSVVTIHASGEVRPTATSVGWYSLNGLSFRVA